MRDRVVRCIGGILAATITMVLIAHPAMAAHESTNTLVFEPAGETVASSAAGEGNVDYRGGDATESRWTATFQFTGLTPDKSYVVAVQGRFGEEGSPEAAEFTPICAFISDASGDGGCWYYFVVLIHLSVVQVQSGHVGGAVVLQATREDGPGDISSVRNRYSPVDPFAPVASPDASPAVTSATT